MRARLADIAIVFAMLLGLTLPAPTAHAAGKPLRIYILAGQSNMQGHAMIRTIDYIGDDPATLPLYKKMVDAQGKPVVAEHVWVSDLNGFKENNGVTNGRLTAGFGARQTPTVLGEKIGPEFTFGLTMQDDYDGPILLIKCAWGGKSLHTDFRPPSAGPYVFNDVEIENLKKKGIDLDQAKQEKDAKTGHYYRLMIDHVKKVLADPKTYCPAYDPSAGFEVAGFVWFQGWNDMADSNVYPNREQPGGYDLYSDLLATFIKDVRHEIDAPKMPFVIGVMGVDGPISPNVKNKGQRYFREAMAAPAMRPEFKGNVVAVETAPYWDLKLAAIIDKREQVKNMARLLQTKNKNSPNADGSMDEAAQKAYLEKYESELISPEEKALVERGASNAGYHYLGCAKTHAQIGQAFANALIELRK